MVRDGQCSFVLDDAWREHHNIAIDIDDELADEDGNWHCRRPEVAGDDYDRCLFHQDPETRRENGTSDAEVAQAFLDAVHGTSDQWDIVATEEMTSKEHTRRQKQFLGVHFGNMDLSYQVIEADNKYPIDLRGATVGELDCSYASFGEELHLKGVQATALDLTEASGVSSLNCIEMMVEGGVSLWGQRWRAMSRSDGRRLRMGSRSTGRQLKMGSRSMGRLNTR